ncbi:MAG: lysine--tRNA ligase [Candidatus ainarchaeum sp.]|nr:lysine--tRNA ligase [Candidatus ainarchaeum sp.]
MGDSGGGELKGRHWSETLAESVVRQAKPPFMITSGITTSGPTHLGTLCEFLFPNAIRASLLQRGERAEFYFIADIYDAFDSIPSVFMQYEAELKPHLGKPLCDVPDPVGKSRSFGDHFLDEAKQVMGEFNVQPKIIRVVDTYKEGKFDSRARFFLENEAEARRVVAESSLRELPNWWSPIMPVCKGCGKIATTRVTSHAEGEYEYACDRDVEYTKGCGFKGKNRISDHEYKLTWRLHWPSWMEVFGTSAEGAGVDHHTRGGSWDTCQAVFREMFKREPPIGYKFGFILFRGKKYSKSKGIGMGVSDLLELMPPELITYLLIKPDLQENKDIDPTGEKLMAVYEDFQSASRLDAGAVSDESRADRKRHVAFRIATGGKMNWGANFADLLMYYQLYRDWGKVGERSGDPRGAAYLRPYIEKWVAKGFAPDEYSFSFNPTKLPPENPARNAARSFAAQLGEGMDALAIHNLVFSVAVADKVKPGELFEALYTALLGKKRGPRLGKLVEALGVGKAREALENSAR